MNNKKYFGIDSQAIDNKFDYMDMHLDIFYYWLVKQGYNSSILLKRTPDIFRLVDTRNGQPFETIRTFVNSTIEVTDNELLGLEFGEFCGSRLYGFIAHMVLFSPTLMSSIENFNKYFPMFYPIYKLENKLNDKYCYLTFEGNENFDSSITFFNLIFVGYIITILSVALDRKDFVDEICLTVPKPRNWEGRAGLRYCRFVFDSDCNYIKFPVKYLNLSTLYGDFTSVSFLKNIHEYYQRDEEHFPALIIKIKSIINGYSDGIPSQECVACRLGISTRTLRRKLKQSNTTYQKVINEVRKEKAIHLLKHSNLRLYQISDAVGFKDLTSFRRAFKKWTGNNFKLYR